MGVEDMKVLNSLIYNLVVFLLFMVLSLYPFFQKLRFSLRGTAALCVLWTIAEELFVLFLMKAHLGIWPMILHWVFGIPFMLILVSEDWGQVLFVQCFLYSQMSILPYLYIWMMEGGGKGAIGILLVLTAVCLLDNFFSYCKFLLPILTVQMTALLRSWSLFWMFPYVVFLFVCFSCYFWETVGKAAYSRMVLYLIIMSLFFQFIYLIMKSVLVENAETVHREKDRKNLALITRQYEEVLKRQEGVRKLRHDMRHFLRVMNEMVQEKNFEGLQDYLCQYGEMIEQASYFHMIAVCTNPVINGMVSYYFSEARKDGIEVSADCDLQESLPISDLELSGIIGNLLENALEACRRMEGGRPFIRMVLKSQGESILVLMVENSYQGQIQTRGKLLVSSNRDACGIGLSSVCEAVEHAGGTVKINYDGSVFRVSVMMAVAENRS